MAMLELMEREAALEALRAAWLAAIRGRGSWGFCDELATPRPLGAIRDPTEALPGPFADALRDRSDPEVIQRLLLDELRTDEVPTVLIIEDAQWADQATMDCLTVIGRRVHDLPVVLVITFRAGDVATDHPLHGVLDAVRGNTDLYLDLAPPSYDAVSALAGEDPDRVFELTGGNPFFVTELLDHQGDDLPPSLANAVLGRVARLGADTRALLELVSIVPARVRVETLDRLEPGWPSRRSAAFEEERASTAYLVGRTSEAITAATHAQEQYEQLGRMVDAGRTLASRAQLHWFSGDGTRAREAAEHAVALAEGDLEVSVRGRASTITPSSSGRR